MGLACIPFQSHQCLLHPLQVQPQAMNEEPPADSGTTASSGSRNGSELHPLCTLLVVIQLLLQGNDPAT